MAQDAQNPNISSNVGGFAARYCSKLTRLSRSNFYVSFLFLPKAKRRAIHSVYAFCRVLDDSVDETSNPQERVRRLQRWKRYLEDAYQGRATHLVMMQLIRSIQEFSLPKEYFLSLIEGVEMDLSQNRYETFENLRQYCYRVASVVGLLCIRIFGYKDPGMPSYAENLGIALQCTNILRDIGKDAAIGRIYIPKEDLQRFGVSEQDIREGKVTDRFRALMAFECDRAQGFYNEAEKCWRESELSTMFPAVIMKTVYARLLAEIRARDYDVFGHEFKLSARVKLWIALKIYVKVRFA